MKRPKVDFKMTETEVIVSISFKKMGKACRFTSKLYKKPPKGVVLIKRSKND